MWRARFVFKTELRGGEPALAAAGLFMSESTKIN